MMITDLIVRTGNAQLLEETLRQLPGCGERVNVVEGSWNEHSRTCVIRIFGDPEFVKFAMTQQGYGEILDSTTNDSELF